MKIYKTKGKEKVEHKNMLAEGDREDGGNKKVRGHLFETTFLLSSLSPHHFSLLPHSPSTYFRFPHLLSATEKKNNIMATRTSGQQQSQPKVLIVGAGLGGVMLGILLEKADIPYTIVERSTTVKPLGECSTVLSYTTSSRKNYEVPHFHIIAIL